MKNTIGIFTLLLISQSVIAEETKLNQTELNQAETQLLESDAAEIDATSAPIMKEQSGFSSGSVVRSAFTREIAEREPTEDLKDLTNESGQVKFFTELRDMSGQTAVHRWQYDGKVVAEVEFNVKGPRWRVWSSKSIMPEWTGDWKVSVVNGAGEVISEKNLSVNVATAGTEPAGMKNTEAMTSTPEASQ